MRTNFLTPQLLIMFLIAGLLFAQSDESLKGKIKNIKGDINSITISTTEGNVTFEGEDAKELYEKMKSRTLHKELKFISEDGDAHHFGGNNVMVLKSKDGKKRIMKHKGKANKLMMFMSDDDDIDIIDGKKIIKVEVDDENGEKEITVTTNEDGEEKVETYKGKEADEYMDKMKDEHSITIDIDSDSDEDLIWIHEKDFDTKNIEKKIDVKIEDGVKKVTIKTTKDGKETVEVYEGDEADKFLDGMHNEKHNVIIKKHMKDGKKYKKVIIKEIVEEDEK